MSQSLPPDFSPWDAEETPAPAPRRRLKPGVKTLLWTLTLIIAVAVILNEGVLRIRNVAVVGNERFGWAEIVAAAGLDQGVNYFAVEEAKIRDNLEQNRYLVYEGMEKHFPNGLTLYVRERTACANVQVMGVTYLLDDAGMVLERSGKQGVEDSLMVVTGFLAREVRVGKTLVPGLETQLAAYRALVQECELQGVLEQISELNLSDPDSLYLVTRDGYTAHLGDAQELRAKIGTVRAVIAKLREMGKYGGVIEAAVPAVATYTPAEL